MKTLDQTPLKPKDRRAIEAAAAMLRQRFPVAALVLFGSKARGDDDDASDIDLLVLTQGTLDWRRQRELINALFDVELEYGVVFSPLVVSAEDWDEGVYQVLPIHQAVEEEGVWL